MFFNQTLNSGLNMPKPLGFMACIDVEEAVKRAPAESSRKQGNQPHARDDQASCSTDQHTCENKSESHKNSDTPVKITFIKRQHKNLLSHGRLRKILLPVINIGVGKGKG